MVALVVVFAAPPAAAQSGICRQAELLEQEYFAARGEYSSTRSGWNRAWETGRDAGLGALIARGTTRDWRTIAQVASYVGGASVVKQEITGWRQRRDLRGLREDMLAAQIACDRQEQERLKEEQKWQLERHEKEELHQQVPTAPPPPLRLTPTGMAMAVENCFERTIVLVRTNSGDQILHPRQRAEVTGQPEFWAWTGTEWSPLEQRHVHSVAGSWQIY